MFPKPYQQGWIHGLPGYETPGGVPVEVVQFTPPKAVKESWFSNLFTGLLRLLGVRRRMPLKATELNFTILAAPEVRASLDKLAAKKTPIPRLSFVIRTDENEGMDDEYQMGGATIESVLSAVDPSGATVVNTHFENVTARMGVQLNPGHPCSAPEIQPVGMNTGWLFMRESSDPEKGEPLDVVDFTPPNYDGRLALHLGKPSPVVEKLAQKRTRKAELILVLPERAGRRYVEFKLWDVKTVEAGERKVAFESSTIEWLMG